MHGCMGGPRRRQDDKVILNTVHMFVHTHAVHTYFPGAKAPGHPGRCVHDAAEAEGGRHLHVHTLTAHTSPQVLKRQIILDNARMTQQKLKEALICRQASYRTLQADMAMRISNRWGGGGEGKWGGGKEKAMDWGESGGKSGGRR